MSAGASPLPYLWWYAAGARPGGPTTRAIVGGRYVLGWSEGDAAEPRMPCGRQVGVELAEAGPGSAWRTTVTEPNTWDLDPAYARPEYATLHEARVEAERIADGLPVPYPGRSGLALFVEGVLRSRPDYWPDRFRVLDAYVPQVHPLRGPSFGRGKGDRVPVPVLCIGAPGDWLTISFAPVSYGYELAWPETRSGRAALKSAAREIRELVGTTAMGTVSDAIVRATFAHGERVEFAEALRSARRTAAALALG